MGLAVVTGRQDIQRDAGYGSDALSYGLLYWMAGLQQHIHGAISTSPQIEHHYAFLLHSLGRRVNPSHKQLRMRFSFIQRLA